MTVLSSLNPGVRETVVWLRECGFDTCDSGDGATHDFGCDREGAYVSIQVYCSLLAEAARLHDLIESQGVSVVPVGEANPMIRRVSIQANYDPTNSVGVIDIDGLSDRVFPLGRPLRRGQCMRCFASKIEVYGVPGEAKECSLCLQKHLPPMKCPACDGTGRYRVSTAGSKIEHRCALCMTTR